ncbi:MAG: DUF86 domain-containing protein [Acinetobacter sp.]|jgi:uncharacterized protein YutE (UPF0331/DUF86 family)|nr:MAG: DUF86 domain-containing protein [Acinetobacter sp.]
MPPLDTAFIVRTYQLGLPQSARDIFQLLAQSNWMNISLAENLQKMVGFRNIAVHDDQKMNLDILVTIIKVHLQDFLDFGQHILK